ncbi:MAG: class I SAM-dependent methyltransferase [Burkholderiales bacterium]
MSRRLHIGGTIKASGWEVLNANAAPYVDHVGNANDLSRFAEGSFTDIYASHVLEHLDYTGELVATLKEWRRVLEPGGAVHISVPDMDVLADLFMLKDRLSVNERFQVMRMMFGGHEDRYDYHLVGLNEEFLSQFLLAAGYSKVERVANFDWFDDTSRLQFRGTPISLNMIAVNPG